MQQKDQYVILTGGKNNAGDFLIKYRTRQLLRALRPDRGVVDLNGWEALDREKLEIVNSSRGLLLAGGPALQEDMYPRIYALTRNLSEIKVPVITLGIGYKDLSGSWERTKKYELNAPTVELLKKINDSGYRSGVRDYLTLNVLLSRGFRNFVATGCPALFDLDYIGRGFPQPGPVKKVAFSLGVSYVISPSMFIQMQEIVRDLAAYFSNAEFEVIFHHSINRAIPKQKEFVEWLEKSEIRHRDISGSEEQLMKVYASADLHIGYRVHAHIFMSSVSKPSILLNEDSRGKGVTGVIGGWGFDTFDLKRANLKRRLEAKLKIKGDVFIAYQGLARQVTDALEYELRNGFPKMKQSRANIDMHFPIMEEYLKSLP